MAEPSLGVQLNSSAVGHFQQNSINYEARSHQAIDALMLKIFGPISDILGSYVVSSLFSGPSDEDKENIQAHLKSVFEANKDLAIVPGLKQKKKLIEVALESSDANQNKHKEYSAAWRAALEGILKDNDYHFIDVVKILSADDINTMCLMLECDIYDATVGDRLKNAGIARREMIRHRKTKVDILISFALIVFTASLFVTSEIYPLLRDMLGTYAERYVQITKWACLFVFIIHALLSLYTNRNRFYSYILTSYGRKIANRVLFYLEELRAENPEYRV